MLRSLIEPEESGLTIVGQSLGNSPRQEPKSRCRSQYSRLSQATGTLPTEFSKFKSKQLTSWREDANVPLVIKAIIPNADKLHYPTEQEGPVMVSPRIDTELNSADKLMLSYTLSGLDNAKTTPKKRESSP